MSKQDDINALIWEWLDYNPDVEMSRKAQADLHERLGKLVEEWDEKERQHNCKHSWSHRNDGGVKLCRLCKKIEVS